MSSIKPWMMHFPRSQWNTASQTLIISDVVWIPSHTFETKGAGDVGALWKGLCLAKGTTVKEKTVSDFFHFKQDLNRHKIYFQDSQSKNKFQSLMLDAYNAPTSVQADQAAKQPDALIGKNSTNVIKMKGYKSWWWRRKARWQRWCRSQSASNASSAELK